MNYIMEFKEVKFNITSNISLIVSLAYYEGHPVLETKKTKINYNGTILEVNRENKNNIVLTDRLIPKSLRSIFSIELVNYLNRLINGDNLYEVYVNNSNKEDKPEELTDYVFKPEKALCSAAQRDIESRYIKDLINNDRNIDLELLDQYRNSKYPTCVHNFDEINYVPIYTYVHPRLAKNQGSTIHIMHLGLLFQLLARIKGLPEFNTQASISALNSAMRANKIGVTIETVNKSQYDDLVKENERLRGKLQKKQDKLDQIIEQNNKLLTENNEQKEMIEELLNLNLDSNQQITVMRKEIRNLNRDVNEMSTAITRVNEDVGVLTISNQKLNMVHDVFIIYFSEHKPVDEDRRNDCADEEVWLGTYNGQLSNYIRSVPADAYNLYQINSNRLDSYKFMTESQQLAEFILDTYQRSIKIRIADFHRFIDVVDNLMNSDGKYESIRNVQVINEAIRRQERQHREANAIINRKKQLLQQYNDMHINVIRYKRVVYAKINEELVKVNSINDAYNYDWFYKYGSNGCYTCQILEPLLNKNIFTNDYDRRINYE